jgi:hypothetical protein
MRALGIGLAVPWLLRRLVAVVGDFIQTDGGDDITTDGGDNITLG